MHSNILYTCARTVYQRKWMQIQAKARLWRIAIRCEFAARSFSADYRHLPPAVCAFLPKRLRFSLGPDLLCARALLDSSLLNKKNLIHSLPRFPLHCLRRALDVSHANSNRVQLDISSSTTTTHEKFTKKLVELFLALLSHCDCMVAQSKKWLCWQKSPYSIWVLKTNCVARSQLSCCHCRSFNPTFLWRKHAPRPVPRTNENVNEFQRHKTNAYCPVTTTLWARFG